MKAVLERIKLEAARIGELVLALFRGGGWRSGIAIAAVLVGVALALVLWLTLTAEETVSQREARVPKVKLRVPGPGEVARLADAPDKAKKKSQQAGPEAGLGGGQAASGSASDSPNRPADALLAESPYGPLPRKAPDGRVPWQYYARPFDGDFSDPLLAFAVTGLGLNQALTERVLTAVPAAVTLGFQPYNRKLQTWLERARRAGHETLLMLPMEPVSYPRNDPGPKTLLTTLETKKNIDRLEWLLSRGTGYIGVTDYMGERFLPVREEFEPILESVARRGLLFLDSGRIANSSAPQIAQDKGMPALQADRVIDAHPNKAAIQEQINKLIARARQKGTAIGVGGSYPVTVTQIAKATASLKNVTLAPVSVVVAKRLGAKQS